MVQIKQTISKNEELKEEKLIEKKNSLISILTWIRNNLKFLLIPTSGVPKDLLERESEYKKTISKRKFLRRLKAPLTILGIGIIFTIVTLAIFAPWISPYTFEELNGLYYNDWSFPSPGHPWGQSEYGQDVLGRCIYGARASLTIALPAIIISVVFGVILGVIAAYYSGLIDTIIMRIMDIFLAFPGLILILALISIYGQNMELFIIAYGILGISGYARLVRASVLQARDLPYVDAARVSGAGNFKIMFRHLLPNCIQPIIISFTFSIGGIILSLAGLSFLGFGDVSLIEWGNELSIAKDHLHEAFLTAFYPGLMITLTVLGFMLLGDGLRDALDPKLKNM